MAFLLINLWRKRDEPSKILICFFLLTSSLIFLNYFKPFFKLESDAAWYNYKALMLAYNLRKHPFDFFYYITQTRAPGYVVPLAMIYLCFADSLVAGYLFSAFCGVLSIYQLYYITFDLYGKKTADYTALFLAISPYFCWLSTLLLRETLFTFIVMSFFRALITIDKRKVINFKHVAILMVTLLFTSILRVQYGLLLGIVLFIYYLYSLYAESKGTKKAMQITLVVGMLMLLGVVSIYYTNVIIKKWTAFFYFADIEYISMRAEHSGRGGSAYTSGLSYKGYKDILIHLPILTFYFLGSPFPWQVSKLSQGIAMLDSLGLWLIYFIFLFEIPSFWRQNRKWAIILFAFLGLGILGSACMQGNVGAAERHRVPFTLIFLPFAVHRLLIFFEAKGVQAKRRLSMGFASSGHPSSPRV